MTSITLREIAYDSPEYDQTVDFRYTILRQPLNLTFTPADRADDAADIHLAAFAAADTTTATPTAATVVGTLVLHPPQPPPSQHADSTLDKRIIKMRQVAVAPHTRGTGIGRKLVSWSEEVARQRGYTVMVLNARTTAVGFYLALGYKCVGEEFDEVSIPHQRMEKELI